MAGNRNAVSERSQSIRKDVRAFVAIELPESVLNALNRLQEGIREYGFAAKWTRAENIHLTLKFLGNIAPGDIDSVGDRLAAAARETAPLTLVAQGLGVFPNVKRPRVLWTGVGGDTDRLGLLQQKIESGFEALGYEREPKRFTGHFTLARFKDRVDPEAILSVMEHYGRFLSDPFTADQVHLFESKLTPKGPIYDKLISHRLAAASS